MFSAQQDTCTDFICDQLLIVPNSNDLNKNYFDSFITFGLLHFIVFQANDI